MKTEKPIHFQIGFPIDNRKLAIENALVPPTGFGNYCSSGGELFTIVFEYAIN